MSGQFVVFTFMGPLLAKLTGAGPDAIGLVFALYGVFGFIGIAIATRIVDSWGAYKTSVLFTVVDAGRRYRLGAERRHLSVDGRLGRDLGAGLCLDQFDAAGAAGRVPRRRSRRHRCRSTHRCSTSDRRSAPRSAACCLRAICCYGAGYVAMAFVALALMTVILTRSGRTAAGAV